MSTPISRPGRVFDPARGLLLNDHFQMSYATNDIGKARAVFSSRYGIEAFRVIEGKMPAGGFIHAELAWVGSIMYEIVTASGPGSEIYMSRLPGDTFSICHHHLGFLVYDQPGWDALQHLIEDRGFSLLSQNNNEGFMRHCFVDAPDLGHYLEFIFPEPAGLAFLEDVPGNRVQP